MIRYALKCDRGHSFESWFASADAYEALAAAGRLSCAVCGSAKVEKALMAPSVQTRERDEAAERPLSGPLSAAEQALAELRARIERETEDVGEAFPDEARAIHYGDAPKRGIRGQAKPDEARALIEEGIEIAPLPFIPRKSTS